MINEEACPVPEDHECSPNSLRASAPAEAAGISFSVFFGNIVSKVGAVRDKKDEPIIRLTFKNMLEKQGDAAETRRELKPEPAESFEMEFLNEKSEQIKNAMADIGGFVFRSGGSESGSGYFEGERRDGTKIRIIIEKGAGYKSPKEVAEEKAIGENS